jgi:hypothetical protein
MFKYENSEQEILESMQKVLLNSDKNDKINKLSKVIDNLNSAILIFKNAGLVSEAKKINNILDSIIAGE